MGNKIQGISSAVIVIAVTIITTFFLGMHSDVAAQNANQETAITWLFNTKANSDPTNFGQHEPHLAISRTDPDIVVSVAKDYRNGDGNKQVWIYVSQDGGYTWPLELQLQIPGLPTDVPNQSDPIAMSRDDGRIYVVSLGYDQFNGQGHGLFITWTDDSGNSWRDPSIAITHNQTIGGLDDKEWLAIDNSPQSPYYHNMYVAWATDGIQFKRSIDGGLTWTANPVSIAPGSTEYPYPVVGPDGTLYVFYMDGWGYCADGDIKYVKSVDGGLEFSAPYSVVATSQPCSPIHGDAGYDQWRFFSIITAATDPTNPDNIWVAWTDDNGITYGKTDVLYVRTIDGGASWSEPARLSHDDPGNYTDHITPVFSMSLNGRLNAFWLDRRADPNNILFHGYHTSTLDGVTWETDTQVSFEPFDLNIGFPQYSGNAAGDYWGLDTYGTDTVLAAWNTTINGNQDIYVARGIYTTTAVTLTGQVKDGGDFLPIQGAQVSLDNGASTITDETGYYTLTVEAGVYTATASAAGYFSQEVSDLPLWSGTVIQDFSLQPEVQLTGIVTDAVTGMPLMDATLTLDTGLITHTDEDGKYSFTLPPGIYSLTASADGYISMTVSNIQLIRDTVIVDFALELYICPPPQILGVGIDTLGQLSISFTPNVSATLPVDYYWQFGDGSSSSVPNPIHTYPGSGTYTPSLDVSNTCGSDSWSQVLQINRQIYLPQVTK